MTDWNGKRVLVTGAEGFIGSTLVQELLRAGATVRAFAHYKPYGTNGYLAEFLDDVELVPGDVRDPGRVAEAVSGCDTVFHLAALIGIPYSYQAPDSYVETNVAGTHHVAAACLRHDARLVHTSTSEVYGTARSVPISEEHPLQPQSPYPASKIGADMLALSYWHSFGLPVTVARPFNTYGPRQSARAVIPAILAQLHGGVREIRIGSTSPTRDFTYVTDTVAGFLALAGAPATCGRVVNIGTGNEISIGGLIDLLAEITGTEATAREDPDRIRPAGSEVERLVCDNRLIGELTGWSTRVSLREGLRHTSDWLKANRDADAHRYQV
ncbi:NAD-dependent dehydratase [Amycolatopsis sp. AA4]|uniref:SDR family NAD(P)-dependent oxidoreductase n=1 Tax=Actinomycetes TaxID=1760 RepID=UPI0001B57050|nr:MULTISPECIES: SDR family NAD(P)-dependent oxidoreductase [Actinomycetes]ATY12287.1 NAD-dependent dehydratase [Amycolatopsis sp. AA4]